MAGRKPVPIVQVIIEGNAFDAKCCTNCKEIKPLSRYHIRINGSGGRHAACMDCRSGIAREEAKERTRNALSKPSKIVIIEGNEAKVCSDCGELKLLTKYSARNQQTGARVSYCKLCASIRSAKYREANPNYDRIYRASHPEVARAVENRRRAMERALPDNWTSSDEKALRDNFGDICPLTHQSDIHVDHFVPLSWGHGGSIVGNMIPLYSRYNNAKSAANPYEWARTLSVVEQNKYSHVCSYIAALNGVTPDELREFVYWAEANKRTVSKTIADNKLYGYKRYSIDIWREGNTSKKYA